MPPRPPLAVHEALISRHFAKDVRTGEQVPDDVLEALRSAMAAARGAGEKALSAHERIMANQMRTPIANAKEARTVAFKVYDGAARQLDAATTRAAAELKSIEAATMAPPRPKDFQAAMISGEVRAALKGMSPEQRRAALLAGDDELVGAVLHGQPLLTGMSPAEHDMTRETWRRRRFPAELDRADRIQKAVDDIGRGGQLLLGFVCGLTNSEEIAAAEASEKSAKSAATAT